VRESRLDVDDVRRKELDRLNDWQNSFRGAILVMAVRVTDNMMLMMALFLENDDITFIIILLLCYV
jgi:hypothetical protein